MDTSEKAMWSTLSGAGSGLGGTANFPSPWKDLSSRYVPRTMRDALTLCEFLYTNYGIYKKASEKIVDYFLTRPVFSGQDSNEQDKFEKICNADFGMMERLREVGNDYMCYGNSFVSIHLPFKRVLRCQGGCKSEAEISTFGKFQFQLADLSFYTWCKKCKRTERHKFHDYPNRDPKKIHLIRWNPKYIRIQELFTGDRQYWLDIPPEIVSAVKIGDPFTLQHIPLNFLAAIQKGQRFKFDSECFYHMHENTLAGLNLQGWGIPSVLSAFRNFFRLQVLYRYDEVLKMDYILPLRIISPANTAIPSGNDFMQIGLGQFMQNARNAVQRHRTDGADWNFFPFPVEYQSIGGEGAQLEQSTRDSILAEEDRLLNTRGIPPEIYRANLTLQAAPVALRLFERGHTPLVMGFNRLIQWIGNTIARYLNSGEYEITVEPVTIADNIDDKMWRLQAAMSGLISQETGFTPLGIKPKVEIQKVIEEQIEKQEATQKAQQDAQMKAMTLDSGQGQGDGGGAGAGGMAVGDVQAQAQEIAAQLLGVPESARRQQLTALRQTNDTLHAQVIKYMDQMRNQAGTLGQQAGLQQMGIAKSAAFAGMPVQNQILWMARAFFPKEGDTRPVMSWDETASKMALAVWHKGAAYRFALSDDDLQREPIELMADIAVSVVDYVASQNKAA